MAWALPSWNASARTSAASALNPDTFPGCWFSIPRMMLRALLAPAALLAVTLPVMAQTASQTSAPHKWSIVVHGGAGVIERKDMPPATEAAYRAAMKTAIETGAAVLEKGGSSLDAIEATIQYLEDNPLFNAGKGAVFTADGRNELDSAIMDGATLKAGAVAQITQHAPSHRRGARRDGPFPRRDAGRSGRRRLRKKPGAGAGAQQLLLHRAALGRPGAAIEAGGQTDSAASRRARRPRRRNRLR